MKIVKIYLIPLVFLSTALCLYGGISAPDFISEITVPSGESRIVRHGLATEDFLVQIVYRDGQNPEWSSLNRSLGIWYEIKDDSVLEIFNRDISGGKDLDFRIMIWAIDMDPAAFDGAFEIEHGQGEDEDIEFERVPLVSSLFKSQAVAILESEGWKYEILPAAAEEDEVIGNRVIMQIPKHNEKVVKPDTIVKLILEVGRANRIIKMEIPEEISGVCNLSGKIKGESRFVKEVVLFGEKDKSVPLKSAEVMNDGRFDFGEIQAGKYRLKVVPKGGKLLKVTPGVRKIECTGTELDEVEFFIAGEL